jgi:hypothetical protein
LHGFILVFIFSLLQRLRRVLFLDHPIKHEIVFVSHAIEKILEEFAKVANIRLFFEL